MPYDNNLQPTEWLPRSVYVDYWNAVMLNAVALSGPGLLNLLERNRWQQRIAPFFLSFMSVASDAKTQLSETATFARVTLGRLPTFKTLIGVQLNLTCPNVGHALTEQVESAWGKLDALTPLAERGVAIVPKISVEWPVAAAMALSEHPNCDALHLSNTIPFGHLPARIPWQKLFPKGSPLTRRGLKQPGGLSGAPLHPLVVEWVKEARAKGVRKPINAGGGILKPADVDALFAAGASSVSIGSIGTLRPWRLQSVIVRAHELAK